MKSRQQIISEYVIQEEGLNALITDLCAKEENEVNKRIILDALDGKYATYSDETWAPLMTLHGDLRRATYIDLAKNVEEDKYEHNFCAEPSKLHSSPQELLIKRSQQIQEHEETEALADDPAISQQLFGLFQTMINPNTLSSDMRQRMENVMQQLEKAKEEKTSAAPAKK